MMGVRKQKPLAFPFLKAKQQQGFQLAGFIKVGVWEEEQFCYSGKNSGWWSEGINPLVIKTDFRCMGRAMLLFSTYLFVFQFAHFYFVHYFTTCQKEEPSLVHHAKSPQKPPTAIQKPWKSETWYSVSSKDDVAEKGQVQPFMCQVLFCNGKVFFFIEKLNRNAKPIH